MYTQHIIELVAVGDHPNNMEISQFQPFNNN